MRRVALLLCVLTLTASGCEALGGPTETTQRVEAVFARSNNLFTDSEVRVLGLQVGRVAALEAEGPNVRATLEIDSDVQLPADVRAVIVPESLLGERFVQLEPPYVEGPTLGAGATIPLERTAVPAEVDEVLASFDRFLDGLEPETIADLVDTLADTLAGQGEDLNRLLDNGSTTIRVLADSSDDLMAVVSEFADLNETLATRDQQLRQIIDDWSAIVRLVAEESDDIIEGVDNLRRLAAGLRSILDEHADPLVADLEVLTTSLSTVQRNLDRIGTMIHGGRRLFEGAGRAMEYEHGRLALNNQSEYLNQMIALRVTDRLVGLCLRLGIDQCADVDFWKPLLPELMCIDELTCPPGGATTAEAIAEALGFLPPEALEQVAAEAEARQQAQDEAGDEGQTAGPSDERSESEPSPHDRLPLPEVDLEPDELEPAERNAPLRDRLARALGGAR